jgi:hypothetical protein
MITPSAQKQLAAKPANIVVATAAFEKWLARHVCIVPRDLTLKHQHMAESAFPFFSRDLLSLGAMVANYLRRIVARPPAPCRGRSPR